jgi:muramoyltetrapeptide carboxypeptidase
VSIKISSSTHPPDLICVHPDRLIPPLLAPGAKIGVVAPSSAVAAQCPRRFERGIAGVEALGLHVEIPAGARAQSSLGYTSASPRKRADDINRMYADPEIDALLTTIGGYGANHILEYLDLDVIAAAPKFLIGYSDTTVLQAALWQSIGLTSIAGPALLPQFGEYSGLHPFTAEAFGQVVGSPEPPGVLPSSRRMVSEIQRWDVDDSRARREEPVFGPRTLLPGAAEGWLAPINLESLLALAGTAWFPDLDEALLIIEAAEITPAPRLHQGLHQLRHLGVFKKLAGLIVGRFDPRSNCSPEILDACLGDVLGSSQLPVVCDLDFGHTDPLLSLPWGVNASLTAVREAPQLAITEAAGRVPTGRTRAEMGVSASRR